MAAERPIKVAIVGGGCAGVTAAFELSRPEHAGKYHVTLYQQGFRLGGKGASGRGRADRIEEHGLHLWFGFYENAFRLMRECYAELGRDPQTCRMADWQDAFKPDPYCGVMERAPDGSWQPWIAQFPAMPGLPGDLDPAPARWSVADYLERAIALVAALFKTLQSSGAPARVEPPHDNTAGMQPGQLTAAMQQLLRYGGIAGLAGLIQALEVLDQVARFFPRLPSELVLRFHKAIADSARAEIARMTEHNGELRRLWEVMDVVLATIRGIIRHRLIIDPRGFDAIDEFECRQWLVQNGASERSVQGSFLRAHYDLAFAYEDGDVTRPRMAAGQAVRAALRAFFTYRGSFFWKMQAGMGDVVFAPFYEVLVRRGVRFEFFHRLRNVGIAPAHGSSSPHVSRLDFAVQARMRAGRAYQPLIDVRGLPCWPAQPDWRQLIDGERLRGKGVRFESHWDTRAAGKKRLQVGKDFDLVVLAVGLGAIPHTCRELIEHDKRWRNLVEHVKTVPTQALQLWLTEDIQQLGWTGPSLNMSCYVEPFDTWADMPQLIAEESFPEPVRAVAYYCSVLRDGSPEQIARADYPEARRTEVRQNAIGYLKRDVATLWPRAVDEEGQFRWQLLVAPDVETAKPLDEARIDTQYWTANVEPTDRYTLSLPGTQAHRISPLDTTFDNLTVAGDWTRCGFNEGCVEAAVMSGRLAAHALSHKPALEEIVGFDHP